MAYTSADLGEYVESLYNAQDFDAAFNAFEKQALKLGFDGVLYSYMPRVILDSNFYHEPVYKISSDYSPSYLKHYFEARLDRVDPIVKAIVDGVTEPIDWWGTTSQKYRDMDKNSEEAVGMSRRYGIANGITIPTMSEEKGIAGASFVTSENKLYTKLKNENLDKIIFCTKLFHDLVLTHKGYIGHFIKPVVNILNTTEQKFLGMLALGESPSKIASKLCKSEKYLEQVMLKMRRKMSGVERDEMPNLNRNQLLYYAGLLNLLEQID